MLSIVSFFIVMYQRRQSLKGLWSHKELFISRWCGVIAPALPYAVPLTIYILLILTGKSGLKGLDIFDPIKLIKELLTKIETNNLSPISYIAFALLLIVIGKLLKFWIERLPLKKANRLVDIYCAPSDDFAAVAREFVDERLNHYVNFLTSAQQGGGFITSVDFDSLHPIVGKVTSKLYFKREQQLTTTISIEQLCKKVTSMNMQVGASIAERSKFIRFFICDDSSTTFNLDTYSDKMLKLA